ncbi:MAG: DUF2130 domain-containing protein [Acholeplasmatales bacterium]|nr:DUF2130 domain-containing protein [Acholeplasmatales bacterium]
MKKVNVIVKDKTLLELAEDANKGDLIDLKELVEVDTTYLDLIIESGKDKVYESKLEEVKKTLIAENKLELNRLNNIIESLKKDNEKSLVIKEQEVSKKYNDTINELKEQLKILQETLQSKIDKLNLEYEASKSKLKQEEQERYSKLEKEYELLKSEFDNKIEKSKIELSNLYEKQINDIKAENNLALQKKDSIIEKKDSDFELLKLKALNEQKDVYEAKIREKEDQINALQHAKSSLNVKQTGEDLEAWCNNEVTSYMQNGLFNCVWQKDNKVIREEDELKGSKADYIFKIYASDKHIDTELLASVCMDMKDENPESVNKKSNADYYKQLDKNREKKNCKYALLVSNLEMDKPNVLPIFKVREYENMYVVRPAYLMTFLNMIASLTTRFAELILSKEVEMLELKNKLDLLSEFEEIKKTYLDKPLEMLEKAIATITSNTEAITKAVKNIDDQCDKINKSYINQINEKINKYELKLNRSIIKKLEE